MQGDPWTRKKTVMILAIADIVSSGFSVLLGDATTAIIRMLASNSYPTNVSVWNTKSKSRQILSRKACEGLQLLTADGVPDLFAPDDCFAWCQPDAVNYVQKNLRILCILFFQSLAIFLICYAGYRLLHYDYRDQSVIVLISSHECKCPFLNCLELSLYVACQKESKIVPVCCESPEGLHIRIILR